MYNKFWIREKARMLMQEILYDNGVVNRKEKEHIDEEWLNKISDHLEHFILNNDLGNIDEACCEIATGEFNEVKTKYGHLQGFNKLNHLLNDYFEQI